MSKNTNLRKITNYLTADNNVLSSNVSQTITGSLTITGNLTAQQFILSSSVTYLTESFASGSHKFGDSSDDNHNFTGSLIVSGSANPLKVGSNLLFVSSSGNVGIGTSSPETYGLFVVNGTAASTGISTVIRNQTDTGGDNTRYAGIDFMIGSDNGTASIRAFRTNSASDYSTALTFWTKGSGANATIPTQRMSIASNGDVIFPESRVINTTASSGYLAFYGNGGGIYWGGSAANQMFLSSGGNLGIGTNAPAEKLHIYGGGLGPEIRLEGTWGSFYIRVYNDNFNIYTPQGRNAISIANNGNVYNYSNTTSWQTTSDIRVKENINTISNALEVITSLNPVSFNYKQEFAEKNNWDDTMKLNNIGFIAQEFETVFPKYVYTKEYMLEDTPIEDFKSIDTGHLVPYLVKAIQELSTKNNELQEILQRNNIV